MNLISQNDNFKVETVIDTMLMRRQYYLNFISLDLFDLSSSWS